MLDKHCCSYNKLNVNDQLVINYNDSRQVPCLFLVVL